MPLCYATSNDIACKLKLLLRWKCIFYDCLFNFKLKQLCLDQLHPMCFVIPLSLQQIQQNIGDDRKRERLLKIY